MTHQNSVHEAVYRIGGPLHASIFLKVSTTTLHRWIRKGFVKRYDKAVLLAKASGFRLEDLRPASFGGRFYG